MRSLSHSARWRTDTAPRSPTLSLSLATAASISSSSRLWLAFRTLICGKASRSPFPDGAAHATGLTASFLPDPRRAEFRLPATLLQLVAPLPRTDVPALIFIPSLLEPQQHTGSHKLL